jgi:very-short-patch-repair endonuclease
LVSQKASGPATAVSVNKPRAIDLLASNRREAIPPTNGIQVRHLRRRFAISAKHAEACANLQNALSVWERRLGLTESPIEWHFLTALCQAAIRLGYRLGTTPRANDVIAVRPQQRVGRYRADFVIAFRFFGAEIDILVECDGHDFHEKTALQAARDKRRDRYFTRLGYRILHFTGAEISKSAVECAEEVLALVMDFQTSRIEAGHMAAEQSA